MVLIIGSLTILNTIQWHNFYCFRLTQNNEFLKMQIDILRHMLWALMNLVLYPLITVLSNIYVVYQLIWYSYTPGMLQESVLRRCNEAFVESMAQFCIQLMILIVLFMFILTYPLPEVVVVCTPGIKYVLAVFQQIL